MITFTFFLLLTQVPGAIAQTTSTRCGWFDNPTPGNASLFDKDGEWVIAVQGGHQVLGDWSPKFKSSQWIRHGVGSYGFGCACFKMRVDADEKNVLEIFSAQAMPLASCRGDAAIKGIEKKLK